MKQITLSEGETMKRKILLIVAVSIMPILFLSVAR